MHCNITPVPAMAGIEQPLPRLLDDRVGIVR